MIPDDKAVHHSLLNLEQSLKASLNPIKPDTQFVHDLSQKLEALSHHREQQRAAVSFLLIAAGLVTGLIIFLIGRRFFVSKNEE